MNRQKPASKLLNKRQNTHNNRLEIKTDQVYSLIENTPKNQLDIQC